MLAQVHPPETRLISFCRGIIEAGWLAAVCVVPLLLNPEGFNLGAETPKLSFLRMVAAIGLSAWALEKFLGIQPGRSRWSDFLQLIHFPLVLPACLVGLVAVASAMLSISPKSSFWGTYEMFQGLLTWSAAFVLSLLIATHLRTREQVERLVTALLVTSFAVSVFALVQRAGFDPRRLELKDGRVISTLGHPNYLAGYLLMAIPLCLWRLIVVARNLTRSTGSRSREFAGLAVYGSGLMTQILAFYYTEARGAFLGLAADLFFLTLISGVLTRRRWLPLSCFITLALLSALLALGARDNSRALGGLLPQRFSEVFSRTGGTALYRERFWAAAAEVLVAKEPLPFPAGGHDPLDRLRLWLGHGPETVEYVIPHYVVRQDVRNENRLHNLIWDQLFSFGLLGLAALHLLFAAAFERGFSLLGIIRSRRDSLAFFLVVTVAALGGGLACWLVARPFMGMGWLGGFVAGTALFVSLARAPQLTEAPKQDLWAWLLTAVLLAGLVGHLVDMGFVFWTAPTLVVLSVYFGLLASSLLGGNAKELSEVTNRSGAESMPTDWKSAIRQSETLPYEGAVHGNVLTASLITGLALTALLATVIYGYFQHPFSFEQVMGTSLFRMEGLRSLLVLPVLFLWVIMALGLAIDTAGEGRNSGLLSSFFSVLVLSGIIAGGYALYRAVQIVGIGPLPDSQASGSEVLKQAAGYARLHFTAVGFLILVIVLTGWSLIPRRDHGWGSTRAAFAVGAAICIVCLLGWEIAIQPVRGLFRAEWGFGLEHFLGQPRQAAEVYREALALNAYDVASRVRLALLLNSLAQTDSDRVNARKLYSEAESILDSDPGPKGLDRCSFYLGELCLNWALAETNTARSDLAAKAADAFRRARVFEPKNEEVWTSSALVDRLLCRDDAAADSKMHRAHELAAPVCGFWAEFYGNKSLEQANAVLRAEYVKVACDYYNQISQNTNFTMEARAHARFGRGKLLLASADLQGAVDSLQKALDGSSPAETWSVEAALAKALARESKLESAEQHAQRALALAPPAERDGLLRYFRDPAQVLMR